MMTEETFTAIYDEHNDAIFRHLFFRIGDREQALDLMQQTFMKAWDQFKSGKEISQLKAYLYKIANNLTIDFYRKKKSTSLEDLMEKGFDLSTDNTKENQTLMDARETLKLLDQLQPPAYQEVIMLRYLHDLSLSEIAISLKVKENAVSVRLNRALKKFKTLISRHEG